MSTTDLTTTPGAVAQITDGAWQLDPTRSSVEFHVRHFYGLMTVKGEFADYDGRLDLGAEPAVELTLQAASLDTKMTKRDEHLRSGDFFDVERHPQVRFVSDRATLDGDQLTVHGQLHADRPADRAGSSTRPCARSTASWRSRPSPRPTTASWA